MAEPFLRWAGSKRKLLPVIREHIPHKINNYIEPFVGSACLFFALGPQRAILGDINDELIHTYRQIQADYCSVVRRLVRLRRSRKLYLSWRALEPENLASDNRAARFIYLNRYCFNGLYRTNLAGQFNVPFGAENTGSLPNRQALAACSRQLRNARLIAGDFPKPLALARPGDFVYMDPPFAVAGQRVFREYNTHVFTADDLVRLREWMCRLDRTGVRFVVSYAESGESERLAGGFYTRKVPVRRNIAGFARNRKIINEVLIFN